MAIMDLVEIQVLEINPNAGMQISVGQGQEWKIESAGIGETGGSIYLVNTNAEKIGILYSSINQGNYSSVLPFWLQNFDGGFLNESAYKGMVSIYTIG